MDIGDLEDVIADAEQDEDPGWEGAAIPNFIAQQADLDHLRGQMEGRPQPPVIPPVEEALNMPNIHSTPINKFNRSQALLSLAFLTLFPQGAGDFTEPRQQVVEYKDYIERLMKFHNGRFTQRPGFPYIAFNTLIRQQINTQSAFFLKKNNRPDITIEELHQAFNSNSPESKAILNSVIRYSNSLQGSHTFWNG